MARKKSYDTVSAKDVARARKLAATVLPTPKVEERMLAYLDELDLDERTERYRASMCWLSGAYEMVVFSEDPRPPGSRAQIRASGV